jgi:hypothetical protein
MAQNINVQVAVALSIKVLARRKPKKPADDVPWVSKNITIM